MFLALAAASWAAWETRRSVKVAREIGEAQVRCYLSISMPVVSFMGWEGSASPVVSFEVVNSGNSPALSFMWRLNALYDDDFSKPNIRGDEEFLERSFGTDIDTSKPVPVSQNCLECSVPKDQCERADAAGEYLGCYFTVYTRCWDVFGQMIEGSYDFYTEIDTAKLGQKVDLMRGGSDVREAAAFLRGAREMQRSQGIEVED